MIVELGAALLVVSFGASFGLYALGSGASTLTLPRRDSLGSASRGLRERLGVSGLGGARQSTQSPRASFPRPPAGPREVILGSMLWRLVRDEDDAAGDLNATAHCPVCEQRLTEADEALACNPCDLRFPYPEVMSAADIRAQAEILLRTPPDGVVE